MTVLSPSLFSQIREKKAIHPGHSVDVNRVACVILSGGQGTRLFPLTETRCKPAISFGGRYRLIDVPISSSINSSCRKIFIVTQFLSSSLHRHILQTYHLDTFSHGFIDILTAEQKPTTKGWFQGTADAVRQNLEYFRDTPVDYFLILSGDQLYNINFQKIFEFARQTDADLVITSLPIDEKNAKRMGILQIDAEQRIVNFVEKPQEKSVLDTLKTAPATLEKIGLEPNSHKSYLASMGIYLFKREALFKLLQEDPREDFGKHLIPTKVQQGNVFAYVYDGYWEDIGTIESFYQANMDLTLQNPPFDCYNESNPIYTITSNLPGPKISQGQINNSIICEGSIVDAEEITHSILGPRTVAKKGSIIKDSYVMGNDFYMPPIRNAESSSDKLYIDENCIIRNAIIDKNVYIGKGVQLVNKNKLSHYDGDHIFIRDGITIVMRGASIPDGFIL